MRKRRKEKKRETRREKYGLISEDRQRRFHFSGTAQVDNSLIFLYHHHDVLTYPHRHALSLSLCHFHWHLLNCLPLSFLLFFPEGSVHPRQGLFLKKKKKCPLVFSVESSSVQMTTVMTIHSITVSQLRT